MKKIFYYLSCLMLMALCLSSCSDDDALLPDDFENGPDINVVNKTQVMFPGGKWVDAKTDFTEEELREALMSHSWRFLTDAPYFFYDKKHYSKPADVLIPENIVGMTCCYRYFINDSMYVKLPNEEQYTIILENGVVNQFAHKYTIDGNTITLFDSNGVEPDVPVHSCTVVGYNQTTMFMDSPAAKFRWDITTFDKTSSTMRFIWGEVPQ